MFKKTDVNSFAKCYKITQDDKPIGRLSTEYIVTKYDDVEALDFSSAATKQKRRFIVNCTLKFSVSNFQDVDFKPSKVTAFNNYPVIISPRLKVALDEKDGVISEVLEHTPVTVNTKVQVSGSTSDSKGNSRSVSRSDTSGSSNTATNSFGYTTNLGENPSTSYHWDESTSQTKDKSHTDIRERSRNASHESGASTSMSIKDWGVYGRVLPDASEIVWTFGQEYPWDAIQYRNVKGEAVPEYPGQVPLLLPWSMTARLYDGATLFPPSHLSMFGVNFIVKASWSIEITDQEIDVVPVETFLSCFMASHRLLGEEVQVLRDTSPTPLKIDGDFGVAANLNLDIMALDPLGSRSSAAIVAFNKNRFARIPLSKSEHNLAIKKVGASAPQRFSIFSGTNDLMIKDSTEYKSELMPDTGFQVVENSLSAIITKNLKFLKMNLFFKVSDTVTDHTLMMKHWKESGSALRLDFIINGCEESKITKYVDSAETEGGENNLLHISLRNSNFGSGDYHDFLKLGLNSIEIQISTPSAEAGEYRIRALSIE